MRPQNPLFRGEEEIKRGRRDYRMEGKCSERTPKEPSTSQLQTRLCSFAPSHRVSRRSGRHPRARLVGISTSPLQADMAKNSSEWVSQCTQPPNGRASRSKEPKAGPREGEMQLRSGECLLSSGRCSLASLVRLTSHIPRWQGWEPPHTASESQSPSKLNELPRVT